MQLPVRWRYKLDRWRSEIANMFRPSPRAVARPRLCPACGTLVGASVGRCHQCGASMTFSLAAASRSLSRYLPHAAAPVSYGIVTLCSVVYVVSLLATMNRSGFQAPTGGLGALFGFGGIDSMILYRMGASLPLPYDLAQPWRLVMAVFLHGGLLHIGFNMWVMMSVAPTVEELYGSARFLFIFVATGAFGYLTSAATGHFSVGASGAILGLIGVLLALTIGRQNIGMRMLRSQIIYFIIYMAVFGFVMRGVVDNWAHIGGFASGFLLGRLMADRPPADLSEKRRAQTLGWVTGFAVVASFLFMLANYFRASGGLG